MVHCVYYVYVNFVAVNKIQLILFYLTSMKYVIDHGIIYDTVEEY